MRLVAFFVAFAAALAMSAPAHADTVVGRWCDLAVPSHPLATDRIMTIINRDNGTVDLVSTFRGGERLTQRLIERRGATFAIVDSPSHDRLRIVPASGNLQLLDDDGFIREARRLENTPRRGECLR